MGTCASTTEEQKAEKVKSKHLDEALHQDRSHDVHVHKLLLLGAGDSGKSTMFKQMMMIYGHGYSVEDRQTFINIIYGNVISSMKVLCEQSDILRDRGLPIAVSDELQQIKRFVLDLNFRDNEQVITPELAKRLAVLWADPGIQRTFQYRSYFQLNDSASWFFSKVEEIARPDYIPSEKDVLRARVRTTGIIEETFKIEGSLFKMVDVGGQRNERKKWIHCFSEVTAVLFVASMSEYDQKLFEDDRVNRLDEALEVFEEMCNIHFKNTSMILFLNKCDLFVEKLEEAKKPGSATRSLQECRPEYVDFLQHHKQSHTLESACAFIESLFLQKNKNVRRIIYTHVTCATDTGQMKMVFTAVKDIVIRRGLEEGGLLQ